QARDPLLPQRDDDAAEEALHPLVHEARLAHARGAVQGEEIVQPSGDADRRGLDADAAGRLFTLEAADLAAHLVAVLARKRREVGVPGAWKLQHGTSFFD